MLKGLAHALGNARHDDFHLVRTAREWASVFSVEGPHGETVRVLDVGGAYQSATYLGKRRYEPVFEYYRSFDAAFSCGIMLAALVKESMRESRSIHWRQVIIAAEIAALTAVAFVPNGDAADMCANVVVSFICSLQVEAFRKVHGRAYATTMCTGNLRSATENLYRYRSTGERELLRSSLEYFGIILFFIIGAAAGALVTSALSIKAALIPAALLAAVFVLMFREKV